MNFNSLHFLIFFPIVVMIYFSLPGRWRWILLLAASYYFYMCWKVEYILLILFSTLVDYSAGILLEKVKERQRPLLLILSLVTNLGFLFTFKYFGLFRDSAQLIIDRFNILYHLPELKVLLPVGISFYSFQSISYVIDVYRKEIPAEKHLGYFALYVAYFPQLVAGPIERFDRLASQLKQIHFLTWENLSNGIRLIIFGLFVKMVIADNLAVYVEQVYNNPVSHSTLDIITGLVFYSFQIYSDFYGYSTIALGAALIMGVKLMDNFRSPYLAVNISDFWKRWHISLSTWFRDYLYISLGGNRVKIARWALNIFIVFTLSGLWHGANWTFLIWGSIFGLVFLLERIFNAILPLKIPEKWNLTRILFSIKTFIIVTFAWIFFRSESLEKAGTIFSSIRDNFFFKNKLVFDPVILVLFFIFLIFDLILYNKRFDTWCARHPLWLRWSFYCLLVFSVFAFSGTDNQPFIYFQF